MYRWTVRFETRIQPDRSCTPLFGDGWEIVDYLFDDDCEAHAPPSRERKR